MQDSAPSPSVLKAAIWMVGTLFSFMLMAVAVRQLHAAGIHSFQIVAFRSMIGLAIILCIVGWYGRHLIRTAQPKLQVGRNIIHFGGQFSWVYGIKLLPLAWVFAIEFTIPIWVALLAIFLLGERMTQSRLVAIIAGFAGILLIVQPGVEAIEPGVFVMLFSAICFGCAITATKQLVSTDTPLAVIFYMCLVQLPLGLIPALFLWVAPQGPDYLWLLLVGLTGLSAHYCEASAFRYADATVVVPLQFLRLPLIAIIGYFLYQEPLDFLVLAGAALIFGGNYYGIRAEGRRLAGH